MYSPRRTPPPTKESPLKRFDSQSLINAVRAISSSLVRRAAISSPDSVYANLLGDIWGQSQYATLEVLIRKRKDIEEQQKRKKRKLPSKLLRTDQIVADHTIVDHKIGLVDNGRDKLVAILKHVSPDSLVLNEHKLTLQIIHRHTAEPQNIDIDALRRLWGVPSVIFQHTRLDTHLRASNTSSKHTLAQFYQTHIMHYSPDARIFNILHWNESRHKQIVSPTISKHCIGNIITMLLTKRRSPFFQRNMAVVIETVLYALHPDSFIQTFRQSNLRQASFFQGLQAYEYSRSFTGSLENLHLAKLNRMLKDIRAVRVIDGHDMSTESDYLSLSAISKYCAQRDTLTDRALHAVHHRYVCTSNKQMSIADFVRMYLGLIGCATDPGLIYWFPILDHDGDGYVGVRDLAHFYSERKAESEKRNGIVLADVKCLWIRFCAMTGVDPGGKGITLNCFKELSRGEREFVMCSLLIRRADDGNLSNIAATVKGNGGGVIQ